jgi:hypothetical protein
MTGDLMQCPSRRNRAISGNPCRRARSRADDAVNCFTCAHRHTMHCGNVLGFGHLPPGGARQCISDGGISSPSSAARSRLCRSLGSPYGRSRNDRVRALQLRVLRILAERVAINIGMFIAWIESQIGWMTHVPWPASTLDQHRVEARRLLLPVPAITELWLLDLRTRSGYG